MSIWSDILNTNESIHNNLDYVTWNTCARILLQDTIYFRPPIGRDDHPQPTIYRNLHGNVGPASQLVLLYLYCYFSNFFFIRVM